MKTTYDAEHNVAYIQLHETTAQVTTIKLSEAINIDLAADGTLYGVELLNANEQLAEDQGNLIVESGGQRREIPLRG